MADLPLDQVRTLLAVVDEGTFDAAAEALHVTPSAVSQRVKALEQRTGRVLLLRTKPVRPTESGAVMVRYARKLAQLEGDALTELGLAGDGGPTRLAIAVNSDSITTWLLPALAGIPREPPICFELHRADQDHTAVLLREGLVMAAVTSSPDPVAGCSVRRLGRMRYLAVATPSFTSAWLADRPLGQAIPAAPVVVFDRLDDLQDQFARTVSRGRGASQERHFIPSTEGLRDAIMTGMGWGVMPEAQAEPLIRDGMLVHLAPARPIDVPLFWQQWKLDSPALAATSEAILGAARSAAARLSG